MSVSYHARAVHFVDYSDIRPVELSGDEEEKAPLRHGVVGESRHGAPRIGTVQQTARARHQRHLINRGQFTARGQVIRTRRPHQEIHAAIQRLDRFIQAHKRVHHTAAFVQIENLFKANAKVTPDVLHGQVDGWPGHGVVHRVVCAGARVQDHTHAEFDGHIFADGFRQRHQ